MREPIENIAFFRDLPPDELRRLEERLGNDPDYVRWTSLCERLRRDLDAEAGDRRLFSLCSLVRGGRSHDLTSAEQAEASEAASRYERALQNHPALGFVAADVVGAAEDFDAAWSKWMVPASGGNDVRRPDRRPRRRSGGRVLVRTAIGVAVAVFAVVLVLVFRRDIETVSVTAPEERMLIVDLGGGSTARLLGGSSLSYVPPDKASALDRRAELTGRAFFEVSRANAGFVVTTPTAQVTVLGTSFGITADEARSEVVLATGRLSLSPRGQPSRTVVLAPGQMSTVARTAPPSAPIDVDVAEQLSWTGLFVFASTPLKEIAEQLTEHYRVAVSVPSELEAERVTGTFSREQPLHEILETIASALGAAVRPSDEGGYELVPR